MGTGCGISNQSIFPSSSSSFILSSSKMEQPMEQQSFGSLKETKDGEYVFHATHHIGAAADLFFNNDVKDNRVLSTDDASWPLLLHGPLPFTAAVQIQV